MDWQSLIADIQKFGHLSQTQIASECGCGQATVSELALGKNKNPSFLLGQSLLALHKRVCRKAFAEAKAA